VATPAAGLTCIYAVSASEVYLCAGSQLVRYDGADFTTLDVATESGVDNLVDVWASSASDVWAIGDSALVAHFDGQAWSTSNTGSAFPASIWGSGPGGDVYVLSTFDLMHHAGGQWTAVELDPGATGDGQVWGTSASDVWVMGDSSTLAHFDGQAWHAVETDLIGDLAAVWGEQPDDLWGVGSAGEIAHWDGSSWREIDHQDIGSPYLRIFRAVHGSSAADVWAVGNQLGEGGSVPVIYHHGH
jgi:hypothetical protein